MLCNSLMGVGYTSESTERPDKILCQENTSEKCTHYSPNDAGACGTSSDSAKTKVEDCGKSTITGRCKTDYEECVDIVQLMVGRDFNHFNALKTYHDVFKN